MYNKIKMFLSGRKKLESKKELISGSRYLHSEYRPDRQDVLQKIAENAVLFMGELPREINKNVEKSERGNFTRKFITLMNTELAAIAPQIKKMEKLYVKKCDNQKKYINKYIEYNIALKQLSAHVGRPVSLYLNTDYMGAQGISAVLSVGDDDFRLKLLRGKSIHVTEGFTSLQMNRSKQPGVKKTYMSVSSNHGPCWVLSENLTTDRVGAHKKYIQKLFQNQDTAIGNTLDGVYFDTGTFAATEYNEMNWRERKQYRATIEKIMKSGISPELAKKLNDYNELIGRIADSYAMPNDNIYAKMRNYDRAVRENPLSVTASEALEISVARGLKNYRMGFHRDEPVSAAKIFSDIKYARQRFLDDKSLEK